MLTIKGKWIDLTDHFQTLNWLLYELEQTKKHFINLTKRKKRSPDIKTYTYLAGCTEAAQAKYKKYYLKADDTAAYYTAIILNPTLKISQFKQQWRSHPVKDNQINRIKLLVKELYLIYQANKRLLQPASSLYIRGRLPTKPKNLKPFTAAQAYKRLKVAHKPTVMAKPSFLNHLIKYLKTDILYLTNSKLNEFNLIKYWNNQYISQLELTQFALDIFTIPLMSDECKQLFSSTKILLEDRRSRLKMDIVKVNKLLQHLYRPLPQGAFDDDNIKIIKGIEKCNKLVPLEEYKLTQKAISQSLAIAEQKAIKAEDDTKQAAVATGEKPLKETLAAIKVNDDSNALNEVILLKDNNNPKEEDEEDKLEEYYS